MGHTQAPGASMSRWSAPRRTCGLVESFSLLSFSSVRHAALRFPSGPHDILPVGMSRAMDWSFVGSTATWSPHSSMYDFLQSVERWVPLPIFFKGRFDVGQDVFPEQWLLVSSFEDPCLHRVVDNSLLLMVLSVPASSQNFLEVVRARSRGTYPAFNSGCPVPFLSFRFHAVAGETRSFLPHVL